jgi:hypothetical protein
MTNILNHSLLHPNSEPAFKPHFRLKPAILVISLLLSVFLTSFADAQDQQAGSRYLKLNKPYVLSYFNDAGDIALSPLRWEKKQWIGFAAVAGATLVVYSQDDGIRDFFQRNRTPQKDRFTKNFLDPLGTYYLAGILGGMYVYGLAARDQETETAALLSGKAVILAGAYTFLFKNIFQRERPFQSDPPNPNEWGGPFGGFHNNAFPSGHATVVFAAATVLGSYYKDRAWVGITAFSLAGLVAVSRNYDNKHWASDVLAGSVLGYAIGKLVYNNFENRNVRIRPYGSIYGHGISLSYSF